MTINQVTSSIFFQYWNYPGKLLYFSTVYFQKHVQKLRVGVILIKVISKLLGYDVIELLLMFEIGTMDIILLWHKQWKYNLVFKPSESSQVNIFYQYAIKPCSSANNFWTASNQTIAF